MLKFSIILLTLCLYIAPTPIQAQEEALNIDTMDAPAQQQQQQQNQWPSIAEGQRGLIYPATNFSRPPFYPEQRLPQEHFEPVLEQMVSLRISIGLVCALSLISLFLVLTFIIKTEHSARDVVMASGLNFIIFGTIILVLVVDTTEQLTAAIGVLAAIAGYLFGSLAKDK